jgi:hypothetical protein
MASSSILGLTSLVSLLGCAGEVIEQAEIGAIHEWRLMARG